MHWHYEKIDENGKLKSINNYQNDTDGKITGRFVVNVKAWFDEHPEEAIARGWTKHITWTTEEQDEKWPHNEGTEYLSRSIKRIDDHTVEDDYVVMQKSEAQLALEELSNDEIFFGIG